MAGWEDAPVVTPTESGEAPKPKSAWEAAPVIGAGPGVRATEHYAPGAPLEISTGQHAAAGVNAPFVAPSPEQSHQDNAAALMQGVSPYATSKYFPSSPDMAPKFLGHVEDMEGGQGFPVYSLNDKGDEHLRVNPKTDFMARHPETGRMAVYSRTAQTNESPLTTASRDLMQGMAVGPVSTSIRAVPAIEGAAARAIPHSSAGPPASVMGASAPGRAGRAIGAEMEAEVAANVARDIEAFDELGVRKPPVAFSQGPVAGLGKMVSRIPYLGAPIAKALDQGLIGARDAARAISGRMAPNATVEQAGHTLQQGLDRFRTAGVRDIEPGVLTDLGIQPRAPGNYVGELVAPRTGSGGTHVPLNPQQRMIQRADGSVEAFNPADHIVVNAAGRQAVYENAARGAPEASQGARQRAIEAAPIRDANYPWSGLAYTNRGVPVEAARPLDQVMMGRRGATDLNDAELARLIRAPSQDTSFLARAEALYEKARRSVPAFFRMDERAESIRLAAANTRAALRGIENNIANQIAGQGTINGELAERLRSVQSHFSLDDLFAVRTEVGRQLSNFSPYQATLNRGQLNNLYGALSRDIEVGLGDIANRAYLRSRPNMHNQPNYVRPEDAMRADQALRDFRVADRFYRASMARMERFSRVAGANNPEAAVGILTRAALDGTKGDIGMLRTAMAVLRPEERMQFSALVLDQMGKPKPNAAGMVAEAGFSPATFMTTWKAMNPAAKAILFDNEFRQPMDNLVRVVSRLNNVEALSNTSRSGTDIINFLTYAGGGALFMTKQFGAMAALAAPTAAFSFLMSRPGYVNWISRYANLRAQMYRAPVTDTAPRLAVLVNQLQRMALKDPLLLPAYRAVAEEHGIGERRKQEQPVDEQPRVH